MSDGLSLEEYLYQFAQARSDCDDELWHVVNTSGVCGGEYARDVRLVRAPDEQLVRWEEGTAAPDLKMEIRAERKLLRPMMAAAEFRGRPERVTALEQPIEPHVLLHLNILNLTESVLEEGHKGGGRFVGVRVYLPDASSQVEASDAGVISRGVTLKELLDRRQIEEKYLNMAHALIDLEMDPPVSVTAVFKKKLEPYFEPPHKFPDDKTIRSHCAVLRGLMEGGTPPRDPSKFRRIPANSRKFP